MLGSFPDPALFTLTVDRSRFSSPEEAHATISGGQFVRRLLADLGVKTWVWVLEFQQLTGDGWPHWHVLIDRTSLPSRGRIPHFLDLKRAWALWRDKWGLGGLDFAPKRETQTAAHAVNYITKYLMKLPEGGFPEWVLSRGKRVRFLQGSKDLGPLVGKASKPRDDEPVDLGTGVDAGDELPETRRPARTLIDRMGACQDESNVYAVMVDHATGEQTFRYVGQLPASMDQLRYWAENDEHLAGIVTDADVYGRESLVLNRPVDQVRDLIERHGGAVLNNRPERQRSRREGLMRANRYRSRREQDANG